MPAAATRALLPSPLATVKAESPGVLKAPLTNFFSHEQHLERLAVVIAALVRVKVDM